MPDMDQDLHNLTIDVANKLDMQFSWNDEWNSVGHITDIEPIDGLDGQQSWNTAGYGGTIAVHRVWNKKDRLDITGIYPQETHNLWLDRDEYPAPNITVAEDRGAKAIAKEIERRFLPDYRKRLAHIQQRLQDKAGARQTRETIAEQLAAILHKGADPRIVRNDESTTIDYSLLNEGGGYGDLYLSGDGRSLNLKLSSVPASLAEAICQLVADYPARTFQVELERIRDRAKTADLTSP
jgi:hypothetical protein